MFESGLKSVASQLLPYVLGTFREQRLSILSYHRVMDVMDPMRSTEPTVEIFEWQMRLLSENFSPLPLAEAIEKMKMGCLPERAVAVTFDDGYADNYTFALPVLKKWGVPATVFVATKYLDGGAMWNDRIIEAVRNMSAERFDFRALGQDRELAITREAKPKFAQELISLVKHWEPVRREEAVDYISSVAANPQCQLMLDSEQVLRLQEGGVDIGGHTHSHPILSAIENEDAKQEILRGKETLEALLGRPLRLFAYPNGKKGSDFSNVHKDMVEKAGFEAAVSTEIGVASARTDPYELPRFTPWDATPLRFLSRIHMSRRNVATGSRA